jgi:DNA invertase Pin-like site-specific DNA recombinase
MLTYGYARDGDETGLARQVADMVAAGIPADRIFRDVGATSAAQARPGLDALLAALHPSDEVVTYAADRLLGGVTRLEDLVTAFERVGATSRTLDGEAIGGQPAAVGAQIAAARTQLVRD